MVLLPTINTPTLICFSFILKQVILLELVPGIMRPVLSNEGKVSCSRKQMKPL